VHPVIHVEFIALQVDAGKKRILGERIIRDQELALRQQVRNGPMLLVVTAQQEEDLGLKGIAFAIAVEV
jgi:hypothetical protein